MATLSPRHGGSMDMDMGMNMGMDNSTTAGMMNTAFTTSLGAANLWFPSWTPTSPGSTFGACLGLFFLAILSRFLTAVKACAETAWATSLRQERLQALSSSSSPSRGALTEKGAVPLAADSPNLAKGLSRESSPPAFTSLSSAPPPALAPLPPFTPPFRLAIDLPRSLLFGLQSFVTYLLMLAVMTFDVWFFVAILVGLMVGEVGFGRFVAAFGGGRHGIVEVH
ncbi:hypothetical protein JCM11641_000590 [Rhodosporidiobolus odoratus]